MTRRDIRDTTAYQEMAAHFGRLYGPSLGRISGASDPAISPAGDVIAFTGTLREKLEGTPGSRIAIATVADGSVDVVTTGPNSDRLPKWSPDGKTLAFLSDRDEKGVHQVYLLHRDRIGEAAPTAKVDGIVEYFH